MKHTIWIREGAWRVLAQYATRAEAMRTLRQCREDGTPAKYTLAGSPEDEALRTGAQV